MHSIRVQTEFLKNYFSKSDLPSLRFNLLQFRQKTIEFSYAIQEDHCKCYFNFRILNNCYQSQYLYL
jgi:hypothetical protein